MNADFPPPGKNCIQVHAIFLRWRKVRVHSSIQTTVSRCPYSCVERAPQEQGHRDNAPGQGSAGTVMMDKADYIAKVMTILGDETKFECLGPCKDHDRTGQNERALQTFLL